MEEISVPATGEVFPEKEVIDRLRQTALTMSAWLKFLGILTVIGGAVSVLSIVGILFAWIPIWLGVLLFQAGDRAYISQYSEDLKDLVRMLEKLKMYFMVTGIVTIMGAAFVVVSIFFAMSFFNEYSRGIEQFMRLYF